MASRKLIVEVVGDSRSLERTFARSAKASRQFGNDTTTSLGKVDSAFSRTQRIAAGGFIGGAAISATIAGIRQVARVAAESQQVLGQTRVALESTGKSWATYGKRIEETIQAQSKLGFDDEALLQTFSQFQRTTGNVGEALKLNNLAMDVARARFIDLEQAANLVTKAAIGNAGALRRLGIDAKVGSSSVELLTLLTQKYGGSAKAASDDASTAFARAQVSTENFQEAIGRLLLPALGQMAAAVENVTDTLTLLTDGLGRLGKVKIPEIEIPLNITVGGETIGGGAANTLKQGFKNAAERLPLVGPFIEFRNRMEERAQDEADRQVTPLAKAMGRIFSNLVASAVQSAPTFGITTLPTFTLPGGVSPDVEKQNAEAIAAAEGRLQDVLASQKRTRDGLKKILDNAKANFKDQKKIDDIAKRYGAAQVAVTNTQEQIASNAKSEAAAAASAAESAKATAKSNRDAAAAALEANRQRAKTLEQARQFRALGLDPTGNKPPPTISNLLKQIKQLGTTDLSKNERGVLARIRKVLVDPLKKATPETRNAAKGLIDGIRDELDVDKKLVGPLTKTTSLRANKLIAGLGLGPDQIRELRARLSSFNSAGMAVAGTTRPTGTFRGGVVVENHNTVEIDGQVVGRNVTRSQQKSRKRNPVQKRGSRRGGPT